MYDYIRSAKSLVANNLRFTRECNDMVHMTLQDWTVDTSGGLNHEQSLNAAQGTEPTLKGNHSYEKYSEIGYKISTGNTEGARIHTCCPMLVVGLFSEHFDIKTEEGSVGIRDCDNIQVTVTERMCIDTFVCMSSYNIYIPTISDFHRNSSGYYYKHI